MFSNKHHGTRGHGGLCLFIKSSIYDRVTIVEKDSNGFLCVKLSKTDFGLNDDLFICFCYIPPNNSVYYASHNTGFFESLEQKIRTYQTQGEIVVMGDLNSRIGERSDYIQNIDAFNEFIPEIDKENCNTSEEDIPLRFTMDKNVNTSGLKRLDICKSSDLKIVNGRIGSDAGIGSYTYYSTAGNSLIDYVFMSYTLFNNVDNFIVHDIYSCSSHVPIELDITVNTINGNDCADNSNTSVKKIVWDSTKKDMYHNITDSQITNFDKIVNNILSSDVDINEGIEQFSNLMYENAFSVFGQTKTIYKHNTSKNRRKHKSPWFTNECETARHDLRSAAKQYTRQNTRVNCAEIIGKRRVYRRAKRKAQAIYKSNQSKNLNLLAKTQPQKFWSEIRKVKTKNSNKSDINITKEEFLNHFEQLYSSDNEFSRDDVENKLLTDDDIYIDQLDTDFDIDEIRCAILSLKRGKSGGTDLICPEMFIDCAELISPLLCKLFNFMYLNCIYPNSWAEGIIVPIPKKGDPKNVNNYRGITLTSIFSKIFSILLDNRLRNWAEKSNNLSEFQFGFRKGKSTTDCIFVLTSIINKVINQENKKLYSAFVDFRKAFDVVYRNGIWFKLMNYGTSTKFTKMLRKIYECVRSCVKVNGSTSDFFESRSGVKQGEPLSPLLFLFFLNDMYDNLYHDSTDHFTFDDIQMFLLLFADDTAIFSYTQDGLQRLLNRLKEYCNSWGITVNIDKTVVMVFKKSTRAENVSFYYDDKLLKLVTKFTYLGMTLSTNGKFYQAQKSLSQQAMRALFSLNSLFDIIDFEISEKLKLFDSMISPILHYSSCVWGFHKAPDIEKVHLKFLKQVLNVKQQTSNAAVYGELGRVPLCVIRKGRILKYWFNTLKRPESLQYQFMHMCNVNGTLTNEWTKKLKTLIDNLGFSFLWNSDAISNLQVQELVSRVYDDFYQSWFSDLNSQSKLETYKLFKTNFEIEKYLCVVRSPKYRSCLTRFRCSSHRLLIEEGRFRNIPREERICQKCSMNLQENEYHFLLVCPFYRNIRLQYLPQYFCHWPSIGKFKTLLSCQQKSTIDKLAKYVYQATIARS